MIDTKVVDNKNKEKYRTWKNFFMLHICLKFYILEYCNSSSSSRHCVDCFPSLDLSFYEICITARNKSIIWTFLCTFEGMFVVIVWYNNHNHKGCPRINVTIKNKVPFVLTHPICELSNKVFTRIQMRF